jgi:hypothetical protein
MNGFVLCLPATFNFILTPTILGVVCTLQLTQGTGGYIACGSALPIACEINSNHFCVLSRYCQIGSAVNQADLPATQTPHPLLYLVSDIQTTGGGAATLWSVSSDIHVASAFT